MSFLELTKVSRFFGGLAALQDVDLSVSRSQIHALIGPNGAGKSTLLNVLTRIYDPTSGSMSFDGSDLVAHRAHELVKLGISRVFQHMELFPRLTVLENTVIGGHCLGKAGLFSGLLGLRSSTRERAALNERAMAALTYVGLQDFADMPASIMTGGQGRLLGFARALVSEPKLLLLDELVAGLNSAETAHVGRLVRRLRDERDITILVIEHDMRFIMDVADHITVLNFGRRIASGEPEQVRNDPDVVSAYLGTGG
jgi:branched-chain amino acid transport system ATP-binding protein